MTEYTDEWWAMRDAMLRRLFDKPLTWEFPPRTSLWFWEDDGSVEMATQQ